MQQDGYAIRKFPNRKDKDYLIFYAKIKVSAILRFVNKVLRPHYHTVGSNMSNSIIREATLSDLDRCYEIESTAYSGNEAATRDKIRTRIRKYPQGFLVLEYSNRVVGMINSGATNNVQLSDESFKELIGHDPDGKKLVIMSVAVLPKYQHRGFGGNLLSALIDSAEKMAKTEIFIICQTGLIEWYKKYGFEYLRPSDSQHGGLRWHEMSCPLKSD